MPKKTSGRGPDPRIPDIRALLVRSGNLCAFPGCQNPIVTPDNIYVAQVCHIEAASPGGPRYNRDSTVEARRSERNLLLLCYQHHIITNDAARFPTSALLEMKRAHESKSATHPYHPADAVVERVLREADQYWLAVGHANEHEHIVPDLRVPIDAGATPRDLVTQIRENLSLLGEVHGDILKSYQLLNNDVRDTLIKAGLDVNAWDAIPYYENPMVSRDWETTHLSLQNLLGRASVALSQLELRILESELKSNPHDHELHAEIERLRSEFLDGARSWGLVD